MKLLKGIMDIGAAVLVMMAAMAGHVEDAANMEFWRTRLVGLSKTTNRVGHYSNASLEV